MRARSRLTRPMALAALLMLSGCASVPGLEGLVPRNPPAKADAVAAEEALDDAARGRKAFHDGRYGLAEQFFRAAVEQTPGNGAAWLGLAAAYDRLRRFDLADRAYGQAFTILGPDPALLNNRGYSYMLRGDTRRAAADLAAAQAKAPENKEISENIAALDGRLVRKRSSRE